ncbi:DUF885 domain-containing protein [Tamlana fucoidanivorans]|uniref:DUF885 domain-containing protein n=1 Tax=Allotamlana fucoidanivorans TaxID=2583814 RepID=A0A5C4SHG4_9FLAO|nr:DUF885 domain-containing protein [Tamlana fucoidanivorans]TNJ42973.1 DUF885 domain-containing protein [Tamlana fucoidanivorans]
MVRNLLLIACVFLSVACKNEQENTPEESPAPEQLAQLLKDYYNEGLAFDVKKATDAGIATYNDQFPNTLSEAFKMEKQSYYEKYKSALKDIDATQLSDVEQMSKDVLTWDITINLEGMTFKKDLMPIDQMWSMNLDVNGYASAKNAQPFHTVKDYENWLKRVDDYLIWLEAAKKNMREGMKTGYVLPKPLIVKVIPQFEGLATSHVNEHLYYAPVLNFPESFSESDKEKLVEAYTNMVNHKVKPVHEDMVKFLKDEYLPAGRETHGIADTPLGKAYYTHQIKRYTTTNMTADAIHELGLQEVARIRTEMSKVMTKVGFKGDLFAFFEHIRTNKAFMPFTERSQVIAFYDSIYAVMKPQIDQLFSKQPKTPFEVRRTEPFREKSVAANYSPGSLDGTRPGIFYTPIPDVEQYNIFDKEDLFLHEAIPGHHFQISLAQENEELPEFRKTLWYSAYGEGWALYTESLGKELGLYKDPYQYFGMLSSEMHRAIRLVVDTGIHAKGWTREQAIQFSLENEAEAKNDIISEIERYMANPGQALSYKIGQLKLIELRQRGEEKLGEAFDIRAFHNEVLETGCIPLQLLEEKINRWIDAQLQP